MRLGTLRFLALLLAGLGLAPGAAHMLELPVRMGWEPSLYAAVTSSLYRLFGSAGAAFQIGALLLSAALAWRVRRRASFRPNLYGCLALMLSLLLWGALVAPVNAEWAEVIRSAPQAVPAAYARLRLHWEAGHACAFAAWLAGYCLLIASVLREMAD